LSVNVPALADAAVISQALTVMVIGSPMRFSNSLRNWDL
jgi:hypothetical protein